jgi:tetratricopeptide (TPR) repeat protein
LPVSQIFVFIAIQKGYIATAEHFLYIPSVGILAVLVIIAQSFYEKKYLSPGVSRILMVVLTGFLFLTTVQQNIYSSTEVSMLTQTLQYSPYNIRMRESLAASFIRSGLFDKAETQYREILKIDPLHIKAHISLGKVLCDQGKYWDGLQEYERTPRLLPDAQEAGGHAVSFGQTSLTKGQVKVLMGLLDNNLRLTYETLSGKYLELLREEPDNARAYFSLGVIYSKTGKVPEAIEQYKRAVDLNSSFKEAVFNLAVSYESLGRLMDAAYYYERMVDLPEESHEKDKDIYEHLSRIYTTLGDHAKAEIYLKQAQNPL